VKLSGGRSSLQCRHWSDASRCRRNGRRDDPPFSNPILNAGVGIDLPVGLPVIELGAFFELNALAQGEITSAANI
jgi:hypothetical protein